MADKILSEDLQRRLLVYINGSVSSFKVGDTFQLIQELQMLPNVISEPPKLAEVEDKEPA